MKTGTTCTRCRKANNCPQFDSHTLYGFCGGFEPRGTWKMLTWARHSWRWLKILMLTLALVRVVKFFKNKG